MSLEENQIEGPTIQLPTDLNFRNTFNLWHKHLCQYSIQTTGDEVKIPGYKSSIQRNPRILSGVYWNACLIIYFELY